MSYVNFDAHLVSLACERYLTARSDRINEIREECIQKMIRPQFFGLIKMSREKVTKWLQDDLWHTYNMCTIRGGADAQVIERLLELANVAIKYTSEKTVAVDSDAAHILRKFL